MLHMCASAAPLLESARPRPPMHRVDGVAMTSRESARRRVMTRLRVGLRVGREPLHKHVQSRMVFSSSSDDDDDAPPPVSLAARPRRVRVYYMAVPPFLYSRICRSLVSGRHASTNGKGPFCSGEAVREMLQSCASLCRELASLLREDEAYASTTTSGKN